MGGSLDQDFQDDWAFLSVSTFVERVNDNDESVFWVARKVADQVKEERVRHRL